MSNLIPEGSYPATAAGGVLAKSSTGKEQVAVACSFQIPGGESVIHTWYGFFTEAAYEKTIEAMRIMGFQGDDISSLSTIGSRPFVVVVKHETYEGVTRAKIAYINDAVGAAVKNVMDPSATKSFAASMRAKVAAIKPKPAAQPGVVHPEIKDLPF